MTSPFQTSSQRTGRASAGSIPVATTRSGQNSALRASAARIASCAGPPSGSADRGWPEHGRVLAVEERHAVEPRAHPDHLPRGAELVERCGLVAGHAPRQDLRLPEADREGEALERDERLAQRGPSVDPVPGRQEAAERGLLGRLDLTAQDGERCAPDAAKDVRIAPLALDAAGPELAPHEEVARLEPRELGLDALGLEGVAQGDVTRGERPVGARIAQEDALQRVVDGLEERLREAAGGHHAEGVAVEPRVLGRDHRVAGADHRPERAALAHQGLREPGVELALAQVTDAPQEIVQLVGVPRLRAQRRLDLRERARVEQVAELLLAEQLAQQLAVERERLRATLRRGRVVLVHVGGDVVEEERCGHRRGGRRLDLDEVDLPRREAPQDAAQRGEVEDVLQALPVGLEDDRERAVLPRHLEQALRLEPLLPQRRALPRPPPGDEKGARGVLAEPRAEERGTARPPGRRGPPAPRARRGGRRARAVRRRRGSAGRCRRPTRATAPRGRARHAGGPRAPSTTARGRGRRTG